MPFHPVADAKRFEPDEGITIVEHGVATNAMSVVGAELHGRHIGLPNRRSVTVYVVKEGNMKIVVDGEVFETTSGDMVVAPVGTRRELEGNATLVIVNTPRFDPADEVPEN
jgi:mannose-6-phosphate isomerase-like protein (cupin superfamily)